MKIFGLDISIKKSLQPVSSERGWRSFIFESAPGAFQRGETIETSTALSHSAVFACVDLISADIAKLPISISTNQNGYWAPQPHLYDTLLKKPNAYQNRQQFVRSWIASKLLHGNAYALKERNAQGRIVALHILDPRNVEPLVSSEAGAVFYRLKASHIAGIHEDIVVPAREIVHDRGLTPWHPLIGVSPLTAAGLAAGQGLAIQSAARSFFENGARPSVVLTAPGSVSDDTAARMKTYWEERFSGSNSGRVAILGDGLKPEFLTMTSTDAQVIEQLNFTAQDVARCFHIPAWKIGCGPSAPYTNNEQTGLAYYSDALQSLIESFELCMDEGLSLPPTERTELDVDALLRMDTTTRYDAYGKAIGAGWMTPNEARRRESMPPVDGGDTCYMQQQNFALSALARRDQNEVPQ